MQPSSGCKNICQACFAKYTQSDFQPYLASSARSPAKFFNLSAKERSSEVALRALSP